jgi:hypothetical protein
MKNFELLIFTLLPSSVPTMTSSESIWAAIIVGGVSWIVVFGSIKVIRNLMSKRKLRQTDSSAKGSPLEENAVIDRGRVTVTQKTPAYEVTVPVSSQQLNSDEEGKTDASFKDKLTEISRQKEALRNLKRENLFTEDELNEKLKLLEQKESEIREEQQELLIRKQAEPAVNKLLSLLKSGIITEEEYNEKVKLAEEKEGKIIIKQNEAKILKEQEQIDSYIRIQIQPTVKNLEHSFTVGVFTKEEFEFEKSQVFNNRKELLLQNSHHERVKFNNFCLGQSYEWIDFNELQPIGKKLVIDMLNNSTPNDVLLYNWTRGSICRMTLGEFDEIVKFGQISGYRFIRLPSDFDPEQ